MGGIGYTESHPTEPKLAVILRLVVGLLVFGAVVEWLSEGAGSSSAPNSETGRTGSERRGVQHQLAILPHETSPQQLDSQGCARACGTVPIPYPFGLSRECARSSQFQLKCIDNFSFGLNAPEYQIQRGPWPYLTASAMFMTFGSQRRLPALQQEVNLVQVVDITARTLIINSTAIKAQSCFISEFSGNASLFLPHRGPYRMSRANVFYVSGCRSVGLYSHNSTLDLENGMFSLKGGLCGPNSCNNQFTYPFCNFYDCCTSSMAASAGIYLSGGGIPYSGSNTCGFCCILYPPTYESLNPGDIGIGTYGLQLLWSLQVDREKYPDCSAVRTMLDYACSPRASCRFVDEANINFTGYVCECSLPGFEGDGYMNGTGCEDVDECLDVGLNACSSEAKCTNLEGSYNCSCEGVMVGDGFRNGTDCNYINHCAVGEPNDCAPEGTCTLGSSGLYNCTCPRNSVGDGLASGTGCRTKSNTVLIAGLSGAGVFCFVTINALAIWWFHRSRKRELWRRPFGAADFSRSEFLLEIQTKEGANICKLFTYEELSRATNDFAVDRELGSGGFGTVFEGKLEDGTKLAIKKAKHDVGAARDDTKQFINEVTILSQVNHRNLVKLLGCCLETPVPVLVYEFVSNGTLLDHLRPTPYTGKDGAVNYSSPLDWNKRLKIAIGTAEALAYLHSGTSPPIYHRDVKSANILLDENYVAKVADFGLSKFVPLEATHLSTAIQGTPGYLDPEYFDNYQITDKSDVYSFGVVLLELITSEKPVDLSRQARDHNLALRCSRLLKHGRLEDIIDPAFGASSNSDPKLLEVIHAVAEVAMKCVERCRDDRPTMREVLELLQSIVRSTTSWKPAGEKIPFEKVISHKHVRFKEELMPLVDHVLSSGSLDFYLGSNPSSTSSNSSSELLSFGSEVVRCGR